MMKKTFKKATAAALVAMMTVGLCACGNQSKGTTASADAEKIEIKEWEEGTVISEKEATLSMITYYKGEDDKLNNFAYEKVQEAFPNVTIEFENQAGDGGQTLKTRAATGDLPEIMLTDSSSLPALIESGSVMELDEYIDKLNYKDNLVQGAIQTCLESPDGHIYEFPIGGVSPILWYYNKTVFEENGVEIPTNYEELLAAVETFAKKGVTPLALFGKEPWPLGAFFDSLAMKENPAGLYALSIGEAKASDKEYTKAINKMSELIDAGIFQEGSTNADFETAAASFVEGQSAMFINGSWYITEADEALGDDYGIFEYYPTADAGKEETNQFAVTGGGDTCGLSISTNAQDPELCIMVASIYAYYRELAEYQIDRSVTVPVKTDGYETEEPLSEVSKQLLEMIPNLVYEGKYIHTLENTEFSTNLTEEIQELIVGQSADDFIADIDKSIKATVK